MLRRISLLLITLLACGCIEKTGSSPDNIDPDNDASIADDQMGRVDGASSDQGDGDAGMETPSRPPAGDAGEDPAPEPGGDEEPPPPPAELDPCDRFCQRMDDCLFPACDGLEGLVGDQFCQDWCKPDPESQEFINQTADLTCDGFNNRIFQFSPEIADLCSDEEIPDECDVLCEFAAVCGFESEECPILCRALGDGERQCLLSAREREDCGQFFECIDDDEEQRGPSPEQICGGYCQRNAGCIFSECAPGTLPEGWVEQCYGECLRDPLEGREIGQFFDETSCEEAVEDVRARDNVIDERCDASEEDACTTLCADRIVPCMGVDQAECEAQCSDWDDSNNICILQSDSCRAVNACFGDPEGQERCRQSCDRLQLCMEEACPPRVLPPTLTDGCTAGCLQDPPSEDELEEWENLQCRQIRQIIYQGNQQLRPYCEGGRDFRPTPEECVAFCDDALGACLGVGGRNFCLAGCSSLTRDEYGCALAAQGNCDEINRCLGG